MAEMRVCGNQEDVKWMVDAARDAVTSAGKAWARTRMTPHSHRHADPPSHTDTYMQQDAQTYRHAGRNRTHLRGAAMSGRVSTESFWNPGSTMQHVTLGHSLTSEQVQMSRNQGSPCQP
eukprot:1513880-Rhodomonas_salina.1